MAGRMRSAESLAAEALVLDDLKAVQVFVRNAFALGTRTDILDRAIPVLVRHLGQDIRTMSSSTSVAFCARCARLRSHRGGPRREEA